MYAWGQLGQSLALKKKKEKCTLILCKTFHFAIYVHTIWYKCLVIENVKESWNSFEYSSPALCVYIQAEDKDLHKLIVPSKIKVFSLREFLS